MDLRQCVGLELQRGLRKNRERLHPLRSLFWECTLRCNMHCRHCGSDCRVQPEVPDMPAEDFLKAIDKLTEAAIKGSPNAKVLLAYCYATSFGVHLNTEIAVHLYVGKGQIKYDIENESYTINFEIFKDGTFNKTADLEIKNE